MIKKQRNASTKRNSVIRNDRKEALDLWQKEFQAICYKAAREAIGKGEFVKTEARLAFSEWVKLVFEISGKSESISECPSQKDKPPAFAGLLISCFLRGEDSEVILGDMAESFKEILAENDAKVAYAWYWRQAISTVRPLIQRWLMKIAAFVGVEEFIRRNIN